MISVILPIYNLASYLPKCFESCIQQSYLDFEVICVNDGSTDHSLKVIEDYMKRDKRFVLVNQDNSGVVAARDIGIAYSKGEFLFFLDGDDYLHPLAFEKLVNRMTATQADVVKGNYKPVDENDNLIQNQTTDFYKLSNGVELFDYICSTGAGAFWNHLFRKELFINHVSIPQQMSVGEDLFALLQLSQVIKKIECIEDTTYYYRKRHTSVMNMNYERNTEGAIAFRDKNIVLCDILLKYAKNNELLSIKQRSDIELLACDKMTTFIFSLPKQLLRNGSVFSLYIRCFIFNFRVQRRIFQRSWKCYLFLLFKLFGL